MRVVYHILYREIVVFHLYRDDRGGKWLNEGNKMLDQMEVWVKNSKHIFENKLILLAAEYYSSICSVVAATGSYELEKLHVLRLFLHIFQLLFAQGASIQLPGMVA